ncbi:MAG: hypothetical protein ACE5I3_13640 [Phycisphaerae bacterium]
MPWITITNDFHDTRVRVRAHHGVPLTPSEVYHVRRALCNVTHCVCGGALNERGPQEVEISTPRFDEIVLWPLPQDREE